MRNPVARLKEILGELQRNGRAALALLQDHAVRLEAAERRLGRIETCVTALETTERRLGRIETGVAALDTGLHALAEASVINARTTEAGFGRDTSDGGTGNAQARERILRLAALLAPHRARGVAKVRVGGANDGGYVMLDDWSGLAGALSIGVGNDDAWDCAVLARGIQVAQFDHTITGPPTRAEGLDWQPLGLAPADVNNVRTLRSLIPSVGPARAR